MIDNIITKLEILMNDPYEMEVLFFTNPTTPKEEVVKTLQDCLEYLRSIR